MVRIISDPYCNSINVIERLKSEYKKYEFLIIGFDFDDTIYDYHQKGYKYNKVINLLREAKDLGMILCLYTVEPDPKKLQWKIDYCKDLGIEPDYVNKSPVMVGTTKPFFNILLDDRAGLYSACIELENIIDYIKNADIKPNKCREE